MENEKLRVLRRILKLSNPDKDISGLEGEQFTQEILDGAGIPWIRLDQDQKTFSNNLAKSGGKRADFIIFIDGSPIFIDTKVRARYDGDKVGISAEDYSALSSLQTVSGVPVYALFLIRPDPNPDKNVRIYLCGLSDLSLQFHYNDKDYQGAQCKVLDALGLGYDREA